MVKSHLVTAWRNLAKYKLSTAINIAGLSVGMTVSMLLGLWIWDELSFNKYHHSYDRLVQVMENEFVDGQALTSEAIAIPLADELRTNNANNFKRIALVYPNFTHTISYGTKKLAASGVWAQPEFPEMLTLKMIKGDRGALKDPSSVLITRSFANALFGDAEPINKIIEVDNMTSVKVAGVFDDLPENTRFYGTRLILAWDKAFTAMPWLNDNRKDWKTRYWWLFAELNPGVDISKSSVAIRGIIGRHFTGAKQELFLHPMEKWHLHNEFRNGQVTGGRIGIVQLFEVIGVFVLILACINFTNLSTARSVERAKEVGIRKAIGSSRGKLVAQFMSESLLVVLVALVLSVMLLFFSIGNFNQLTGKHISIPYHQPAFWTALLVLSFFTGIVAGIYPAFYLSAFRPVNVLKGNFTAGRFSSLPRKVLIVFQFSISLALIMGSVIIFKQIQYAAARPVGYQRKGLISVALNTPQTIDSSYNTLRQILINTNVVTDAAKSNINATESPDSRQDLDWRGKDPHVTPQIGIAWVTHDFGNTIGWHITEGRDFSRNFPADTGSIIINKTAAKLIGFKHPVGEVVHFEGRDRMITAVVDNMIMESPYMPVRPMIFQLDYGPMINLAIRLKPGIPAVDALKKIELAFSKEYPAGLFDYRFTDEDYAKKFSDQRVISHLSMIFTMLAIFISCLGLTGLSSFMAEQRRKEIGIRRVLGASVPKLWVLLVSEFVQLILLSILIASPLTWYFMDRWLQQFSYRTNASWWVYALAGLGVIILAVVTVSHQSLQAARMNPVKSLQRG